MKRLSCLVLSVVVVFAWSGADQARGIEAVPICSGCDGSGGVDQDLLQDPFGGIFQLVRVSVVMMDGACSPNFTPTYPPSGPLCLETNPCHAVVTWEWEGFDPHEVRMFRSTSGPFSAGVIAPTGDGTLTQEVDVSCGAEDVTWTITGGQRQASVTGTCDGC